MPCIIVSAVSCCDYVKCKIPEIPGKDDETSSLLSNEEDELLALPDTNTCTVRGGKMFCATHYTNIVKCVCKPSVCECCTATVYIRKVNPIGQFLRRLLGFKPYPTIMVA